MGVNLQDREWKPFDIGDIFRLEQSKKWVTKAEAEKYPGKIPLVSTSGCNNGVIAYIDSDKIVGCTEVSNVITVAVTGSAGATFYQGDRSIVNSGVLVLKGKEFSKMHIYIFMCTLIRQACKWFNYGLKAKADRVQKCKIKLPIDSNGNPDYKFMEQYIKERWIDYSWAKQPVNKNSTIKLSDAVWKEYRIGDLFSIKTSNKWVTKSEMQTYPGKVPLVSKGGTNNGVCGSIDTGKIHGCAEVSNVITISCTGSAGATFYQKDKVAVNSGVLILEGKQFNSKYTYMFICECIKQKCMKYNYGMGASLKRVVDLEIKLPSTPEGTPDYKFMEEYIKSLPYSIVLDKVSDNS